MEITRPPRRAAHTEAAPLLLRPGVGATRVPGSLTPRRGTRWAHPTGWDSVRAELPGSGLGVGGERTQPDATHSHRRFRRAAPVPARKRKPLKRPPLSSTGRKDMRTQKADRGDPTRVRTGKALCSRTPNTHRATVGQRTVGPFNARIGLRGPCPAAGGQFVWHTGSRARSRGWHRPSATSVNVNLQKPHLWTDGHVLHETQASTGRRPREAAPRASTPTCRGHWRPHRTPFCNVSTPGLSHEAQGGPLAFGTVRTICCVKAPVSGLLETHTASSEKPTRLAAVGDSGWAKGLGEGDEGGVPCRHVVWLLSWTLFLNSI